VPLSLFVRHFLLLESFKTCEKIKTLIHKRRKLHIKNSKYQKKRILLSSTLTLMRGFRHYVSVHLYPFL